MMVFFCHYYALIALLGLLQPYHNTALASSIAEQPASIAERLAITTAADIDAGTSPLSAVTEGYFSSGDAGLHPFVFERATGVCAEHGADKSLVGLTLAQIFAKRKIADADPTALHERFCQGGWVTYPWSDDDHDGINNKRAYVVPNVLDDRYYVGVGYDNGSLPPVDRSIAENEWFQFFLVLLYLGIPLAFGYKWFRGRKSQTFAKMKGRGTQRMLDDQNTKLLIDLLDEPMKEIETAQQMDDQKCHLSTREEEPGRFADQKQEMVHGTNIVDGEGSIDSDADGSMPTRLNKTEVDDSDSSILTDGEVNDVEDDISSGKKDDYECNDNDSMIPRNIIENAWFQLLVIVLIFLGLRLGIPLAIGCNWWQRRKSQALEDQNTKRALADHQTKEREMAQQMEDLMEGSVSNLFYAGGKGGDDAVNSSEHSHPETRYSWYWEEDADRVSNHKPEMVLAETNFVAYSSEISAQIERAYQLRNDGLGLVKYRINVSNKITSTDSFEAEEASYYDVIFEEMKQYSAISKYQRCVRRAIVPTHNDVLFGRGGNTTSHTGNRFFRRLVEYNKIAYQTSKYDWVKRSLVKSVVDVVSSKKKRRGRFLGKDKSGVWVEVTTEQAHRKTSNRFRDKKGKLPKPGASSIATSTSATTTSLTSSPTTSHQSSASAFTNTSTTSVSTSNDEQDDQMVLDSDSTNAVGISSSRQEPYLLTHTEEKDDSIFSPGVSFLDEYDSTSN